MRWVVSSLLIVPMTCKHERRRGSMFYTFLFLFRRVFHINNAKKVCELAIGNVTSRESKNSCLIRSYPSPWIGSDVSQDEEIYCLVRSLALSCSPLISFPAVSGVLFIYWCERIRINGWPDQLWSTSCVYTARSLYLANSNQPLLSTHQLFLSQMISCYFPYFC